MGKAQVNERYGRSCDGQTQNPEDWVPERGLSPLYTALPFRELGHPRRGSRVMLLGFYPRTELPGPVPTVISPIPPSEARLSHPGGWALNWDTGNPKAWEKKTGTRNGRWEGSVLQARGG